MDTIQQHLHNNKWLALYGKAEKDHVLFFFYNVFRWIERDSADELVFSNTSFEWRRSGEVIKEFKITKPPSPDFRSTFDLILRKDVVIQAYISVDEFENGITTCRIHRQP